MLLAAAGGGTELALLVGITGLLVKCADVAQEVLYLVKQLPLLDRVEGQDLFQLDIQGANENNFGVFMLNQRA